MSTLTMNSATTLITSHNAEGILRVANKAVPKEYAMQLSLLNGPRQFVRCAFSDKKFAVPTCQ
jgi:hypothetical protein